MTRPDAYAVAAAMNDRPLPADTDGGQWEPAYSAAGNEAACDACGMSMHGDCVICGVNILCLPCAIADVQRAHAAADPNSHTDREVKP